MNRASLYGLLNFYREYVPTFAKLTEPLRQLLGQDAKPWIAEGAQCVHNIASEITSMPRWLNLDPEKELRAESRISKQGIAVLLLQRHPEHPHQWAPVASWGQCLDILEQQESQVMLELKALREGA